MSRFDNRKDTERPPKRSSPTPGPRRPQPGEARSSNAPECMGAGLARHRAEGSSQTKSLLRGAKGPLVDVITKVDLDRKKAVAVVVAAGALAGAGFAQAA